MTHMARREHIRSARRAVPVAAATLFVFLALPTRVGAEPIAAGVEAWRTSPFHGVISEATGKPIPCLCRYRDRYFKLGERVCMSTPNNGVVVTRCDLFLNNTSWVPTEEQCTISFRSLPQSNASNS